MNWQHFKTFLWLRWRLGVNQLRRGGVANLVIMAILAVAALFLSLIMFVVSLLVGLLVLPEASPATLMYIWDGLVAGFLFFWLMGLLVDLQRSELLSLDKFLHLPVSLTGVFVINYVGSLVSLTMILFLPMMVGLAIALVFAQGPAMLLLFPALAAFLLMVTALTYQFRGWLAALMVNKRRRRTVIALVTLGIILVAQLPNLINVLGPGSRPWRDEQKKQMEELQAELAEVDKSLAAGKIDAKEHQDQSKAIRDRHHAKNQQATQLSLERIERTVRIINLCVPPGWLPYAALTAAEGNPWPGFLGAAGMVLIGGVSLRRSYRTTLRLYKGDIGVRPRAENSRLASKSDQPGPSAVPAIPGSTALPNSRTLLVEKKLPWVSEQTSAIALAGFRSLTRAPEAKMLLLSPIILLLVFGTMFLTRSMDPTRSIDPQPYLRPLMTFGAMALILLTTVQLAGNQFGFDRSGFRTFVLCAASRRDILLGKNLSFAPLLLGMGMIVAVVVQVIYPMRFDLFLATVPQLLSMYLLFCLMANWLSILTPMPVASGSLKPSNPRFLIILLHVLFTLILPLALAPTLLPLAIDWALGWEGAPVCLLLSVLELVIIAVVYRLVLTWQGRLFQRREKKILEVVAAKAE